MAWQLRNATAEIVDWEVGKFIRLVEGVSRFDVIPNSCTSCTSCTSEVGKLEFENNGRREFGKLECDFDIEHEDRVDVWKSCQPHL
jgi:hypothetical protein